MCRNMWAHLRITTVLGCSRRDHFPPTFEEQTKKQKQKQQHQKQKWQKPNNYCSLRDLFPLTCESELGNQQQQHQQQDQRKYQQQFAISIWYAISTISISFRRHVKLSMEIKMNIQQYNKNIIIQYQNENTQQQQQQQPSTVEGGNNICSPQLWLANWKRCQSLQLRYSDNRPILFLLLSAFLSSKVWSIHFTYWNRTSTFLCVHEVYMKKSFFFNIIHSFGHISQISSLLLNCLYLQASPESPSLKTGPLKAGLSHWATSNDPLRESAVLPNVHINPDFARVSTLAPITLSSLFRHHCNANINRFIV